MVSWQRALLFPDPRGEWAWAEERLVGLPALVRVLMTLRRFGIEEVRMPTGSEALRGTVERWRVSKDLPRLVWQDQTRDPGPPTDGPILAIQGGILFGPPLLEHFQQITADSGMGKACLNATDDLPIMVSFRPEGAVQDWRPNGSFAELCGKINAPSFVIPEDCFCRTAGALKQPGKDRALLATVEKPTDRWHVRWVRRWTFPALRQLARLGITPNQITWLGFGVGVIGCWLIAGGGYWRGVAGALLLYLSWVLDCVDGTLARLTFSESPWGHKLDTTLGHVTNLLVFSAVIWAVYGQESLWKAAAFAFFMLGGILIGHRVSQAERRLRAHRSKTQGFAMLQGFLDKIDHRDYAVVVFVLALLKGFKFFLWGSVLAIQAFWMVHLWLIHAHRRRGRAPCL